jgi:hypothetical protein
VPRHLRRRVGESAAAHVARWHCCAAAGMWPSVCFHTFSVLTHRHVHCGPYQTLHLRQTVSFRSFIRFHLNTARRRTAPMGNAPSSSKPAPLDVTAIQPQISFTPVYGGCRICHSFESLRGYYLDETHPWDDIVTSAHTCIYCDAIIRGCRGWLEEDGKCDWTPSTLRLDFTYPSEHGETSTYRWRDSNVVYDWHNQSVFHRLDRLRHATETVSHYCVTMTFLSTTITLVILAAKCESPHDTTGR